MAESWTCDLVSFRRHISVTTTTRVTQVYLEKVVLLSKVNSHLGQFK